jgi:hypothetical protein
MSLVKQLLQDETNKHALVGHLPREVAVMYREALARIEALESNEATALRALAVMTLEHAALRASAEVG